MLVGSSLITRRMQILVGILFLCLPVVLYAVFVSAGFPSGSATPRDFIRIPSPDSLLEAVFSENNCGATCPFTYHLAIVARGESIPDVPASDLFTATRLAGVTVRWVQPRVLEVGYSSGEVARAENSWSPASSDSTLGKVRLTCVQRPPGAVGADTLQLWPAPGR